MQMEDGNNMSILKLLLKQLPIWKIMLLTIGVVFTTIVSFPLDREDWLEDLFLAFLFLAFPLIDLFFFLSFGEYP